MASLQNIVCTLGLSLSFVGLIFAALLTAVVFFAQSIAGWLERRRS